MPNNFDIYQLRVLTPKTEEGGGRGVIELGMGEVMAKRQKHKHLVA